MADFAIIKKALLVSIANAIRSKRSMSGTMSAADMPELISGINTGSNTDYSQSTLNSSGQMLSGVRSYDKSGNLINGSIPTKTASNLSASGKTVTVPAGYYASQAQKSVAEATQATPVISFDTTSGKITAKATQSSGYVTVGTKEATPVQLSVQDAKTVTPTTSEQTAVAAGKFTTGAVKVGAIQTQVGNFTPDTVTQTYYPETGKFFSEVTVQAISGGGGSSGGGETEETSVDQFSSADTSKFFVSTETASGKTVRVINFSLSKTAKKIKGIHIRAAGYKDTSTVVVMDYVYHDGDSATVMFTSTAQGNATVPAMTFTKTDSAIGTVLSVRFETTNSDLSLYDNWPDNGTISLARVFYSV